MTYRWPGRLAVVPDANPMPFFDLVGWRAPALRACEWGIVGCERAQLWLRRDDTWLARIDRWLDRMRADRR